MSKVTSKSPAVIMRLILHRRKRRVYEDIGNVETGPRIISYWVY